MHPDWILLGKALCLVAIIEGLAYALGPRRMRSAAAVIIQLDDRTLRSLGIAAMVIGALFLLMLV